MAKEAKTEQEIKETKKIVNIIPNFISFDTWFATTGRPNHHKKGMREFTNCTSRKTLDSWNKIFKDY